MKITVEKLPGEKCRLQTDSQAINEAIEAISSGLLEKYEVQEILTNYLYPGKWGAASSRRAGLINAVIEESLKSASLTA